MSGEQDPQQKIEGNYNAQASGASTAIVNVISYDHVRPTPVDRAVLEEATRLLDGLPLDHMPEAKPFYPESVEPPMDPNPLFVGRDEDLKELAATIKNDNATRGPVKTVCVFGLGGVGKTQLVSEFAYSYGQFFKRLV